MTHLYLKVREKIERYAHNAGHDGAATPGTPSLDPQIIIIKLYKSRRVIESIQTLVK